jgi:hypothetical protein
MNQHYRIFGIQIGSSLPLPAPLITPEAPSEVTIGFGETPEHLENPQFKGGRFQAGSGEFLLKVDNVARYHVRDGNRITITPDTNAHEDDILIFLMGSAMGALLHQRNILVLHAGAVRAKGGSVLFSGVSGAGKSTLTACFHQKGYPFLADDLCAISTENGVPAVMTGFPRLKLWADALAKLEQDRSALKSVRWGDRLEKYFMPVETDNTSTVPVKDVFILHTSNTKGLSITELKGSEKVNALVDNTYRLNFLKGLDGKTGHFHQCVRLGSTVRVHKVVRPSHGFLLNELAEAVEGTIRS